MSKLSQNIIAVATGIFVLAAFILYIILSANKVTVPAGTIGTSAGNLNNYGLVCEKDGMVYFSNPYDEGCLYSMTNTQQNIKKVYNLSAKYINAGGGYIFFNGDAVTVGKGLGTVLSKPGMYMVKENGSKLKALTKDTSQSMLLLGNKVYYQHYTKENGTTFAVVDLKTEKSTELLDFMINPASYSNGRIYYNGRYDNHHLYTFDPASNEVNLLWEGDIWNPICDGDYVYYMDIQSNYRLCRYSISNNVIEVISNDRVDCFNYYGGIIYYQKSSSKNPQLIRINADGTDKTVVADGVYNSINITSTYTYFKSFTNEYAMFYTPTFGTPSVYEFTEAAQAAINSAKKK